MSLEITDRALRESRKTRLEPQLVLEIEDVGTLFGAVEISRLIRIGDPGLQIGDNWRIGGVTPVEDQASVISFGTGTSTKIEQQLQPEKGSVSSVSSVQVSLIDKNFVASKLISPGVVVDEILGKKATLWMGFKDTAFKEDYVAIISGIIDDVDSGAGNVKLNIAAPEQLKRQQLFEPESFVLAGTVEDTDTVIETTDASRLPAPIAGPDGSFDPAAKFFVQIEDEIIQYTGISGNNLTGCSRGALATLAKRHVLNQVVVVGCTKSVTDSGLTGTIQESSLLGKYFCVFAPGNKKYYVWFNVLGAYPDPALPDAIGVEVAINNTTSEAEVQASVVAAALNGLSDFSAVASGSNVIITNANPGKCPEPDPGTAGFQSKVVDEGNDELTGKTLFQLADSAVNCALKLMLSGVNDYYETEVPIARYLHPTPLTTEANSIYFEGIDLNRDFGVVAGDWITIESAAMPANNCAMKKLLSVNVVDGGSWAVVDDVAFVEEADTVATCSFRSQFDTLGYGLGMTPDQVDVLEHIFWNDYKLASYAYRFVIKDTITGKDFLDKEIYLPVGAFSLPRKGRCSMGYHVGPVIRDRLKVLDRTNVKDPDKIRLRRTINRNFYNTIAYQFEQVALTGKLVGGSVSYAADSLKRIPVGTKALKIVSTGLRRGTGNADNIAESVALRYLGRYKYAAEFFETVGLLFRDGYPLEPGDVVLLDPAGLQITNTLDGTRAKPPKVFTVMNKSLDLKTGNCTIALTDTNFDESERYGSVSPSSEIVSGTTTKLLIRDSFGAIFPGAEWKKWEDYLGLLILVHNADWSFVEEVTLQGIDPANNYQLLLDPTTPLSVPPTEGMVIDVAEYPESDDPAENARYKAVHAFMGATIEIVGAADDTHFEVAPGDVERFAVDGLVRVHNAGFTEDSGELTVKSIVGNIIETAGSMGFTPTADHVAEGMPFADGGQTYRIF